VVDVADCPTAYFSPKNLRSILYNLLSNGLKYAHPDRPPVVQIRSRCLPGRLVLTVQDNGLGLTQEQQGKLFVLFQRLHTHVEGSGVGLYMVKRIVENAGGSIEVQSQPGVGTRFTVSLPMPITGTRQSFG
jgi:two-component system, sensor histidine kinase